jgi:mRNA interferase MazF
MKRGAIVISRAPGDFTTKARPYVVVQSDESLAHSGTISLCPLTSQLTGHHLVRVPILPDAANGLAQASEIEVDMVMPMRKSRIEATTGLVAPDVMARVDTALRRWLAL